MGSTFLDAFVCVVHAVVVGSLGQYHVILTALIPVGCGLLCQLIPVALFNQEIEDTCRRLVLEADPPLWHAVVLFQAAPLDMRLAGVFKVTPRDLQAVAFLLLLVTLCLLMQRTWT